MAKFYANRVKKSIMSVEEVPALWRTAVEAELAKE